MLTTTLLIITLLILLYKCLTKNHDYWQKLGVPHNKPYPFFGTTFEVAIKKETYQESIFRMYKKFEGCRYVGMYNFLRPTLLIRDPELIIKILKTDFSYFSSRGFLHDYEKDPLSLNLFFMDGHLWKRSRELLRPGFKSGRLRPLVPEIENTAKMIFGDGTEKKCFEVTQLAKKFTSAVTFGSVFGLDINETTMNTFFRHSNESFNLHGLRAIPVLMRLFVPKIALFLGFKVVPKVSEDFFINIVKNIKAGREDNIVREDYVQTLFTAINGLSVEYKEKDFLDAALCGQFFIFLVGGYESTSSMISFSLHCLAKNPDICKQAREEILNVTSGKKGEFTYDQLKEMKYLDNIINEVLRLYPPIGGLYRVCTATYRIPDTDVVLKPGDPIIISVIGVQNDAKYFDHPEEFRPSRFNESIPDGTFIPFAYGPRNCIGMRLALMNLKTVLAYILVNYELSLDPKTPEKLKYDEDHLITMPKPNVWINFTPFR